jgi:hypothetical protein
MNNVSNLSFGLWTTGIVIILIAMSQAYRQKNWVERIATLLVSYFFIFIMTGYQVYDPAYAIGKAQAWGVPKNPPEANFANWQNWNFTPQAFVITEKKLLLYETNGKVYDLTGLPLEPGLSLSNLSVGSNVVYTVYSKGSNWFLGKL